MKKFLFLSAVVVFFLPSLVVDVRAQENLLLQESFWRFAAPADVRTVLAHGADIHAYGSYNRRPLHFAAGNGTAESVTFLLDYGADKDMEARNLYDATPLHYAAANGSARVAEALLLHGASIHARDKYGKTPLFTAVEQENVPVVELLLDYGVDIHTRDNDGQTPLHQAALLAVKEDIAELLLRRGADAYALDGNGETPLDRARRNRNTKAIEILLAKRYEQPKVTPDQN